MKIGKKNFSPYIFLMAAIFFINCGREEMTSGIGSFTYDNEPISSLCSPTNFGEVGSCPSGYYCLPRPTGLVASGGECAQVGSFAIQTTIVDSRVECVDGNFYQVHSVDPASKSRWYWCPNGSYGVISFGLYAPYNTERLRIIAFGLKERICLGNEKGYCLLDSLIIRN